MGAGSFCRGHAEAGVEAQQIAVGIGNDELTVTGLHATGRLPPARRRHDIDVVPPLFEWHHGLETEGAYGRIRRVHVRHEDLEVDAAAEWTFQGCRSESAARSIRFLQHD